ncbi:MAG: glycosyltransferase family 9 protein [Selenomonadaceae bacterium]|nr:glycosyltransferase family 9 protein [Selenomonadaceae bacterium]
MKIFVDGIMHLGDMMIASSVFPVIKKKYPEAEVHFLVMESLAPAAELIEGVDKVIPYAYKSGGGVKGVFQMANMLRKEKYDIGISVDPRERVTLMKWLAGIPVRVTVEEALGWKLGWERLFYHTDVSLNGWDVRNRLMSESFHEAMRRYFGIKDEGFIYPTLKPSSEKAVARAKELFSPLKSKRGVISFCVVTSGDNRRKDWPAERFAELSNRLIKKGYGLVFTGIAEHNEVIAKIIEGVEDKTAVLNIAGKTNLEELVAVFRASKLFITLDTGSAHLAAVAGAKVLTIFSFNSPEIYGAAGKYTKSVSAHVPCSGKYRCFDRKTCDKDDCFALVTVDMVESAADELLQ